MTPAIIMAASYSDEVARQIRGQHQLNLPYCHFAAAGTELNDASSHPKC